MASDLAAEDLIRLAIEDFQFAWNAVSSRSEPAARSNFMFGKQAMVLLELAARACASDSSGTALADLATQMESREPRYFAALPGRVWAPGARTRRDFRLPAWPGDDGEQHLLAAIFNLVRNGQAHQYQQMRAVLNDRTELCVQLTGAQHGLELSAGAPDRREHLSHWVAGTDLWMKVRPDVLFVDFRDSIRAARLESRGLSLRYLVEDRPETFAFTHASLKAVLDSL
jgi:hypothetical protein